MDADRATIVVNCHSTLTVLYYTLLLVLNPVSVLHHLIPLSPCSIFNFPPLTLFALSLECLCIAASDYIWNCPGSSMNRSNPTVKDFFASPALSLSLVSTLLLAFGLETFRVLHDHITSLYLVISFWKYQ